MKTPINHRYEGGECYFNPHVDFYEFLEEAKKHKSQEHVDLDTKCAQQTPKNQLGEAKKNKQSWKRSFLSLWKLPEKKNNSKTNAPASSQPSKASRGGRVLASGPLYGSVSGSNSKAHGPRSGPLATFFVPNKRVESEMAYVCLGKVNNPNVNGTYGPVYLVT